MNGKDRFLVTLGIIGIIAIALFTSFGRNFFYLNIPSLVLPEVSSSGDTVHTEADWMGELDTHAPIAVTTSSVQGVIASLERTDSYFQKIVVELFWADDSSSTEVSVWRNGTWIAAQQQLPSGLVRHDLVGATTHYYWYGNGTHWRSFPADEHSADLSLHIPTYEDVVALDQDSIQVADYQIYNGVPAIYVEAEVDSSSLRYWISTQTGLLLSAEVEKDDNLIYRLTATDSLQTPCPSDAPFSLPDGTTIDALP